MPIFLQMQPQPHNIHRFYLILTTLALKADGLRTVDPKGFIKWMTFSYTVPLDYLGNPVIEKPYGFEVRNFHNDEDRADFWRELQKIMREKRRMSMQGVLTILNIKRRESVKGA